MWLMTICLPRLIEHGVLMARIPGLAIGLAIGAVAVISAPILARHMRPVAKAAFKGALAAADELRVKLAEFAETTEDLMAEVRAERAAEAAAATAGATADLSPEPPADVEETSSVRAPVSAA
jgi:hypothetical protein